MGGLLSFFRPDNNTVYVRWQETSPAVTETTDPAFATLHRGFHVANVAARAKVDEMYAWLGERSVMSKGGASPKHLTTGLSVEQLTEYAHALYSQTTMWAALDTSRINEADYRVVHTWKRALAGAVSLIFCIHLQRACSREFFGSVLAPTIIQFQKCFITDPFFPPPNNNILRDLLHKQLECIARGFPEALIVFAHLRPDMVSDTCHPLLAKDTAAYRKTNRRLLQESPVYGASYETYATFL
jgi:hypothetical protein